ncbi:Phage capsid family protein [Clostridiales bacterium CHKCI001]|nr:Phage capsid family protein [Clostridiales bacterium CHKCI001]
MALKVLLLRSKSDAKKKELQKLREKDAELQKREKELEDAVNEMTAETSEEDRAEVEKQVEDFEREKQEHEDLRKSLEAEIEEIENEIKEDEQRQGKIGTKKEYKEQVVENRTNFFGMSIQERNAFFADEGMKTFLQNVRSCIREQRALTNVGLTIPDIALPLIKQIAEETSKLMKYVTKRPVSGTSRQNIMGEIPEAYWDEMCATLKELDLAFYNMEMDGYKVSGYFAVCNAILEDNDVNLASELLNAIGKAIGKAIDKAILYGKGVKMPMGIVTSLTTKTAPSDYPSTGRKWDDLSTKNVLTGKTTSGVALFQDIVMNTGIIDNDYDTGTIVWVMNKKTHTTLISESMGVNSAAAIVAGTGNTMPVIGGNIVELKYIPDDTIIFGYFKNYVLAERAGTKLGQSEHVKFIEDQTVFRGTARYDGKPAIREAFAIYGIGKAPVTTAPKFAGEAGE